MDLGNFPERERLQVPGARILSGSEGWALATPLLGLWGAVSSRKMCSSAALGAVHVVGRTLLLWSIAGFRDNVRDALGYLLCSIVGFKRTTFENIWAILTAGA